MPLSPPLWTCDECGSAKLRVLSDRQYRPRSKDGVVYRARKCADCGYIRWTGEGDLITFARFITGLDHDE